MTYFLLLFMALPGFTKSTISKPGKWIMQMSGTGGPTRSREVCWTEESFTKMKDKFGGKYGKPGSCTYTKEVKADTRWETNAVCTDGSKLNQIWIFSEKKITLSIESFSSVEKGSPTLTEFNFVSSDCGKLKPE